LDTVRTQLGLPFCADRRYLSSTGIFSGDEMRCSSIWSWRAH